MQHRKLREMIMPTCYRKKITAYRLISSCRVQTWLLQNKQDHYIKIYADILQNSINFNKTLFFCLPVKFLSSLHLAAVFYKAFPERKKEKTVITVNSVWRITGAWGNTEIQLTTKMLAKSFTTFLTAQILNSITWVSYYLQRVCLPIRNCQLDCVISKSLSYTINTTATEFNNTPQMSVLGLIRFYHVQWTVSLCYSWLHSILYQYLAVLPDRNPYITHKDQLFFKYSIYQIYCARAKVCLEKKFMLVSSPISKSIPLFWSSEIRGIHS